MICIFLNVFATLLYNLNVCYIFAVHVRYMLFTFILLLCYTVTLLNFLDKLGCRLRVDCMCFVERMRERERVVGWGGEPNIQHYSEKLSARVLFALSRHSLHTVCSLNALLVP